MEANSTGGKGSHRAVATGMMMMMMISVVLHLIARVLLTPEDAECQERPLDTSVKSLLASEENTA